MSHPVDLTCTPPELPQYLRNVSDLKPIIGVPTDEEVIGIHAVIRMAGKFVEVPDMCSPELLSRLSEHLFNAQMAKYRGQYPCSIFHTNTTYTPPALPAHISLALEPVSGIPSDEVVTRVRDAVRLYQKFADIPTMFDPKLDADLSQHLFDLHMEKYLRRDYSMQASSAPQQPLTAESSNPGPIQTIVHDQINTSTNNVGTGADEVQASRQNRLTDDAGVRDAIERSNRLAEQANQLAERSNLLIERSNEIAERANQLMQQPSQSAEPSNAPAERFNQVVEQLNKHLEESNQLGKQANCLVEALTTPIAKFGDVLSDINSVLVGIQHATVRAYRGTSLDGLDCMVNQKGEIPATSSITNYTSFQEIPQVLSNESKLLSIMVNGSRQCTWISKDLLGKFLCFYGIGGGLCLHETSVELKEDNDVQEQALKRLSMYLSSRLG